VPVDPAIRTTHLGHGIFECVLLTGDLIPGQYELRIISMREQQFRGDLARGLLWRIQQHLEGCNRQKR
jgi:hypothetical protein